MSKFFSARLNALEPYVPGEQPKCDFIKLNTNENPYIPSGNAVQKIDRKAVEDLRLYSDPECGELNAAVAAYYGVDPQNVLATNGSDEALAFCFAAFGERGAQFPDVTYGFYKVFAGLFGIDYAEIPLRPDFTVDIAPYCGCNRMAVLANPNAQTGIALPLSEIEKIVRSNPETVVVIDEAYVDFGGESAVSLTKTHQNLVVVQTFSKSRSLAGARVGFAIADEELIRDLNRVKFSFNPYNVNRLSMAAAVEAMKDAAYFSECVRKIIKTREKLVLGLRKQGFSVLPSSANFVLARHPAVGGEKLYRDLRERGVLVRHFSDKRIADFIRVTVGTDGQIETLLQLTEEIIHENGGN